jgi:hypothetical protein
MRESPSLAALAIATLAAACPAVDDNAAGAECLAAAPTWAPGASLFRAADDTGLAGVRGTRISAVDIDDDGDPDLVVRAAGVASDPALPTDDAARRLWVMQNDGAGHFVDVTAASGLAAGRLGFRAGETYAFADVNGDGVVDVYAGVDTTNGQAGGETSEIFLGQGGGRFALVDDAALDAGVRRAVDVPASASFVDVDGDGHLDLWVTEHNYDGLTFIGNRLYAGDGTGSFVDVSVEKGVESFEWNDVDVINAGLAHTRSWSGIACDLDNDGKSELLSASYGRAPNHLWHQARDGSFFNVGVDSGYAYDDDQTWQDNQFALCFCAQNPDGAGCSEVTQSPAIGCDVDNWDPTSDREPFRLGGNNGTTLCGDVDNDGDVDLLTTTIRHWWAGAGSDPSDLLLNESDDAGVRFARPGRDALGIVVDHVTDDAWDEGIMTAAMFDVDNDGRLDFYWGASDYAGNRGLLHMGSGTTGAAQFTPVSVDDSFEHNRSHGAAVADFDGDGDLDLVVGHSKSRCDASLPHDCYDDNSVRLFENTFGQTQNHIQLDLEQRVGSNRHAIGARIEVTATIRGERVTQTRVIGGGHGHFGMQDERVQTIGIGDACSADVVVHWPLRDAAPTTLTVNANERVRVKQ